MVPGATGRHAIGVEPREQRFQVEPLERRDLGAHDHRVVLAASRLGRADAAVRSRELVLDDDIGQVGLEVRRERRDGRHAGKVAVRVNNLVVGEPAEGLAARPRHGLDRDERQETVLARQRKLRVDPLDLDHAAHVAVEVVTAVAIDLAARVGARGVTREAPVVGPGLPVLQVDLEPEHGLDPPDLEREVRTEPGPAVPLPIAGAGQVAVVEVPARRGDLVEEPGDRDPGRRRLREDRRSQQRKDDAGEERLDEESSHDRLLLSGGEKPRTVDDTPRPSSPTATRRLGALAPSLMHMVGRDQGGESPAWKVLGSQATRGARISSVEMWGRKMDERGWRAKEK